MTPTPDLSPDPSALPVAEADGPEAVRAAFLDAFERLGGASALVDWAIDNRATFYAVVARLVGGAPRAGVAGAVFADVSDTPLGEPLTVEAWERQAKAYATAHGVW